MVGSLLIEDAQPLPAELKAFLDEALSDAEGAAYASFGTAVTLSGEELKTVAKGLTSLDKYVLWKLDIGTTSYPAHSTVLICCCIDACGDSSAVRDMS